MSAQPVVLTAADSFSHMNIRQDIGVVWFTGAAEIGRLPGYDLWADRWGTSNGEASWAWTVREQRTDDSGRRWGRFYSAVMSDFGALVEVDECPVL